MVLLSRLLGLASIIFGVGLLQYAIGRSAFSFLGQSVFIPLPQWAWILTVFGIFYIVVGVGVAYNVEWARIAQLVGNLVGLILYLLTEPHAGVLFGFIDFSTIPDLLVIVIFIAMEILLILA